MRSRLLRVVALWVGLVGALLLPSVALGQEADLGGVVVETRALTDRLRAEMAALGGSPPSQALIDDFARRRDLLARIARGDGKSAVALALPPRSRSRRGRSSHCWSSGRTASARSGSPTPTPPAAPASS